MRTALSTTFVRTFSCMVSSKGPEDVIIKSSVVVIRSLQIKEQDTEKDLQEEDNSYVIITLYN